MKTYKIGMAETVDSLLKSGRIYIEPFHHGTLEVGVYAPKGSDQQKPHDKDEVYVVMSGEGVFYCNGESMSFSTGDVLFVPANAEHRFTEFSDDFKSWVFFYGPEGGEED
ncbi:MAG: cupin domain-containing protein [Saprospiraceae bacterium]|nr:cupin domain-containing protein [Saprospiraceae bacterium]